MSGNAELAAVELLKLVIAAEDIQLGLKGPNPQNRAGRAWLFKQYRICLAAAKGTSPAEGTRMMDEIRRRAAASSTENA